MGEQVEALSECDETRGRVSVTHVFMNIGREMVTMKEKKMWRKRERKQQQKIMVRED